MQSPLNTECPNNIALVEAKASFTYAEVERRTTEFASGLLGQSSDLAEARIAFLVPLLVNDPAVFPIWATDFLIVSILAAAMSSMDSVLLVAASTLYKNLVAPFRQRSRELRWTRAAVVGFSLVAALLALNPPGDIVEITIFSGSLYAVCFFPAVVFGLYWHKGTSAAVLWSMIIGVGTLLAWIAADLRHTLHEVFPALLLSGMTYWVLSSRASALSPPNRETPQSDARNL